MIFTTPSQSISVLRFIKQMFQIGMENTFWTCPSHEKRERNLNKGAVLQNRNRVTSIAIQHWTTTGLSHDHHTDRKTAIYLLPHASRRNIVDQQLPTLLDATCCVRLLTLLHVVPCWWELLHPFAHHCQHGRNNSQHRWTNNVGSYCVRLHTTTNTDATTPNILGPTMLGVIASVCA